MLVDALDNLNSQRQSTFRRPDQPAGVAPDGPHQSNRRAVGAQRSQEPERTVTVLDSCYRHHDRQ